MPLGSALALIDPWYADPRVRKGAIIAVTWAVVLLLTHVNGRFFDRVDRRLTAYGVPARRLNKLDFLVDIFLVLLAALVTLFVLGVGEALWGAVAITGIAGAIVALAAQQVGQNLLAGMLILLERPFIVGDTIDVSGDMGEVQRVTLMSTKLVTPEGLSKLVPNSRILGATVTNYSVHPARRLTVTIDVAEAVEMDRVRGILQDAVEGERHLVPDKPVRVFATESLDEGVRFEVRYWVEREHYAEHCLPSATERFLDALNAQGVATAMPAQHVHVSDTTPTASSSPAAPES